jgi:hypothetical protein
MEGFMKIKEKVLLVLLPLVAFVLGIGISTYAITSGPGGSAKLEVGGSKFELVVNQIDYQKLFSDKADDEAVKSAAAAAFHLYEMDDRLIQEISRLDYGQSFSRSLRQLRDRFVGPFNAPDKEVKVSFRSGMPKNLAEVCPSSDFYRNRINIATSVSMVSIDDAGVAAIHGCSNGSGPIENIVVSEEVWKELSGNSQQSGIPINAVAKVLPSYVIVADTKLAGKEGM